MENKILRKIVKIDDEKCNGCGVCVPSCAEGALKIINGKAKLVSEIYCDGLGACLGECPQGAISIEERAAEGFNEEAVKEYFEGKSPEEKASCGCSSLKIEEFDKPEASGQDTARRPSLLGHWPVQLTLVHPSAPFLKGADLLLTGDCVPFAYADFHRDFLKDRALLVACPKLDDFQAHLDKLTGILKQASPENVTVLHMEVPCCSGLVNMAKQAIRNSGRNITLKEITISASGEIHSGDRR